MLIAELRIAFHEGAERALAALRAATDDGTWREAAWRLKGLAASFGAPGLMEAAQYAAAAGREDVVTLDTVRRQLDWLTD